MSGTTICVAGIRLDDRRCVRPLQWNGSNWTGGQTPSLFQVGALIDGAIRPAQEPGALPHRREDLRLSADPTRIGTATDRELYQACIETAVRSIDLGFQNHLTEGRYALEGTDCPSLFGLRIPASQIVPFQRSRFGKPGTDLRCRIGQGPLAPDLKVTAVNAFSNEHQLHWLQTLPGLGDAEIVLRIGLARRLMVEGEARCYAQINGFILPPTP